MCKLNPQDPYSPANEKSKINKLASWMAFGRYSLSRVLTLLRRRPEMIPVTGCHDAALCLASLELNKG